MSIGFHLDDIEEEFFNSYENNTPPIGAPIHEDFTKNDEELPPMGAPYHD